MPRDKDEREELRELLPQMPLVEVEAMAFEEQHLADRRELDEEAARTIAAARSLGRDDIVEKVEQMIKRREEREARLQAAIQHRLEQTRIAEETLNRLDSE